MFHAYVQRFDVMGNLKILAKFLVSVSTFRSFVVARGSAYEKESGTTVAAPHSYVTLELASH
jgi:hypothetical protein